MADRSRREKKNKLDKLAELRRAREGGGRDLKVSCRHARRAYILCIL